jgi:hypothetical protein
MTTCAECWLCGVHTVMVCIFSQAVAALTWNGRLPQHLPLCFTHKSFVQLQSLWIVGIKMISAGSHSSHDIMESAAQCGTICFVQWHELKRFFWPCGVLPSFVQMAPASRTLRCWHATQLCMAHQWLRRISRDIVQGTYVVLVPGYSQPTKCCTCDWTTQQPA